MRLDTEFIKRKIELREYTFEKADKLKYLRDYSLTNRIFQTNKEEVARGKYIEQLPHQNLANATLTQNPTNSKMINWHEKIPSNTKAKETT